MKKLLSILIVTICVGPYLLAGTPDAINSLFYSGNHLYEEGKYKDAVSKYQEIIKQGYVSAPLFYNLGNCYFKQGMLGKTVLYYERAKRLIPNDPELSFNYKYVCGLLQDKIEKPKQIWILAKLKSVAYWFNLNVWLIIITVVWLIFALTSIIAVFFAPFRKLFKYIGIIAVIILITGAASVFILYTEIKSPRAVILSKEVPVRYGPGEGEVEAFVLHEGATVEIKNTQGDWIQIQLPDGKSGWLPQDSIEEI